MNRVKNIYTIIITTAFLSMYTAHAMLGKFAQRIAPIMQQSIRLRSATQKVFRSAKTFTHKHHISKAMKRIASATALSYGLHNTVNYAYFDSQTKAYLSTKEAQSIDPAWRKKNKSIEDYFISVEKQYSATHYVAYHTQPAWLNMVQDVYTILYELSEGKPVPTDFRFLRFWHDEKLQKFNTVNEFLDSHYKKDPEYNCVHHQWVEDCRLNGCHYKIIDGNSPTSTQLVSGSPSFFHGHNQKGCSAFNVRTVRTQGVGVNVHSQEKLLSHIVNYFNLDPSYIKKIIDMAPVVNEDDFNTIAIFIPKNNVNQCVYLSKIFGIPYTNPITAADDFDSNKRRHTKIDSIFELYRTNPQSIKDLDMMQVRILNTPAIMLNPQSGVKIISEIDNPKMVNAARQNTQQKLKKLLHKAWQEQYCPQEKMNPWYVLAP